MPVEVALGRGKVAAVPEQDVSDLRHIATQVNQVAIELHELNKHVTAVAEVLKAVNANIVAKGLGGLG
jgi:hypothetical protein